MPPRRIDDRDPVRLGCREGQETVADALVEVEVEFGLEPGHVAWCLPGESGFDGDVEEEGEVRSKAAGGQVVERGEASSMSRPAPYP